MQSPWKVTLFAEGEGTPDKVHAAWEVISGVHTNIFNFDF